MITSTLTKSDTSKKQPWLTWLYHDWRFWSATNLYQILPILSLLFRLLIKHYLIGMMTLVSLVSFGVRWHRLATDGITWRQWRQVCASDTKSASLMPNWRHRRQISVSDEKFSVSDVKFGVIDVKWCRLTPNDAKWCQLTLKLGIWRRSSSPSVWYPFLKSVYSIRIKIICQLIDN